jgi:cardiolipin synthase (CMP-forming)
VSPPNLITLARIILVPVVVWALLAGHKQLAFAAFLIAGLSDAADGFLAKRFDMQTELGAYLDPLADKLLIVCIFITLGFSGGIPLWLVIAVVSRDVLIVTAVLLSWVMGRPVAIQPLFISKANTVAQITLAAAVLADEAFVLRLEAVRIVLVWVTGVLTLASLVRYLYSWLRHMSEPVVPL